MCAHTRASDSNLERERERKRERNEKREKKREERRARARAREREKERDWERKIQRVRCMHALSGGLTETYSFRYRSPACIFVFVHA